MVLRRAKSRGIISYARRYKSLFAFQFLTMATLVATFFLPNYGARSLQRIASGGDSSEFSGLEAELMLDKMGIDNIEIPQNSSVMLNGTIFREPRMEMRRDTTAVYLPFSTMRNYRQSNQK